MKKLSNVFFGFLAAISFIALLYALTDSLISGLWPQFNGVMVYRFAEFFPRSLGIYFLFILPLAAFGLPLCIISKRLPGLRKRELKHVYNAIGAAVSLIIPIILFEIPNKLSLSYFKPVFLIADFLGLAVILAMTFYLAPLLLSLAAARLPGFILKLTKVAGYLSLVLVVITLFSLTMLPEITRPPYNPNAPNLLIISIDTLRKDHLSYYGYDRIETPNIDAFLESATTFDHAYCSSPWTLPSLAAFLTGYQPSVCGVNSFNLMNPALETLPEYLSNEGYRTECYNTNFLVYPEYGFGRGFDIYMNADDIKLMYPFLGTRLYRSSCALYAGVRSRLGVYPTYPVFNRSATVNALGRQGERPFFIWCHFLDPHSIYSPPKQYIPSYPEMPAGNAVAFRDKSIASGTWDYTERNRTQLLMLYDGETRYVDVQVGSILEALEKSEYAENTIVVMFNDHGEEFWDHGRWSHGYSTYPEVVDMVFAIRDPNLSNFNPISELYVSHIDILPTILEALGLEPPDQIQGKSFYSELTTANIKPRPVLCEYMMNGEKEIKSIRMDGFLYSKNMEINETELYNIEDDPYCFNNLSGTQPDVEIKLYRELKTTICENDKIRGHSVSGDELTLPKDRADKLRDMGYIGN